MNTVDPRSSPRWLLVLGAVAESALYLGSISDLTFVDLDVWHAMALFREALHEGWIPSQDRFAYTPTVNPAIHHEWGAGAIIYFVGSNCGAAGVMVLKYCLIAAILMTCAACARRMGASWEVIISMAPFALVPTCLGFTTLRSQVFTLWFLALLFLFLEADRRGKKWWLVLLLPIHVVWLNLHGGFVVGMILLGAHTAEQALRRRPIKHLLAAEAAMLVLVLVNPYGWQYGPYLWHALRMDRSMFTEWQPLWQQDLPRLGAFLLALGLLGYAVGMRGAARLPGLLLVLACAYAGCRHVRHLSIFGVAWLCFVPAYLEGTGLANTVRGFWKEGRVIVAIAFLGIGVFGVCTAIHNRFWELRVPADQVPHYPVGAVAYLGEQRFHGKLITPFEQGAYVSWKLFPNVKISLDSRYEAAYPPELLVEHMRFFGGQPGWRAFLTKYPPDAILLRRGVKVSELLAGDDDWTWVYQDDQYMLYARRSTDLPKLDLRGKHLQGVFP